MSYFHPERMPVLPPRRRKAARSQLEQIVAGSAKPERGRRVKPAAIVAGTAAIVLATGAAAIAAAVYQPVTDKTEGRCFTVADTSGFATAIAGAGKPGAHGAVRMARQICASLYRQGYLTQGAQRINPRPRKGVHPVPSLQVCTWQDGTAAVFPGPAGTCMKLGLPTAARR
jgi:hypothetical protein